MAKKEEGRSDAELFIDEVMKGRNVDAKERLEKMLKVKTARRIKETLM
jgi:hypothetical protein